MRPFLDGGDMIATGQVTPELVRYDDLPWKFAAGTPNILGTIVSAQALRLLVDLALTPDDPRLFRQSAPLERTIVAEAMARIKEHTRQLTERALDLLGGVAGLKIYGPRDASRRTALVAFNIRGRDPFSIAEALNNVGVESRAGCHCATLAHHALGLSPPASCDSVSTSTTRSTTSNAHAARWQPLLAVPHEREVIRCSWPSWSAPRCSTAPAVIS
jgi:cysteine desulfurase/selenocysteine lyase